MKGRRLFGLGSNLVSVLTSALILFLFTAAQVSQDIDNQTGPLSVSLNLYPTFSPIPSAPPRDDPAEVVFSEDFEEELEGWRTSDLTNNVVAWHKSDFLARQEGDLLWWCGDTITDYEEDYVGYNNIWLQYLDTPVLDLSGAEGSVRLTFDAYWLLEDPRRVPPPQPYDGWDGWLVLISVDGGESFRIIRPQSPDYTARRLSAAERFWRLPGEWPGWVYHSGQWGAPDEQNPRPSWVQCRFDLSDYREEEVVIRFMLVTDRAVAAPWNAYLANSGVLVDNILIEDEAGSVFLWNNGVDDPIPDELIPRRGHGFGDHWTRTNNSSHSGNWSMWNDDDYYNLMNALDTPPFEVPQGFNTHFQFWVWCDLPDAVHQGAQVLSDFYQIYLSADGGESWTYQTHDYNRDVAGGQGWTHYVPGVPFTGNTDLSLTQYAGQRVQLRWLFRTDNDHQEGNGRGLFIDDVEVIAQSQQPRDVGMKDLFVPYPLTVGLRQSRMTVYLHNFGTRDQAAIYSWWGWTNSQDSRSYPSAIPYPTVVAGDSIRLTLTDYADRRNPGWTPLYPGAFTVWAATRLGANTPADPNDDDMNPANDSTAISQVRVWPSGVYELGYDARTIRYRYNFNPGAGPAVRFSPQDVGLNRFHLAAVHFVFNREQNVTTSFRLHILSPGPNINTPGQELYSQVVEVPVDSCYPGTMTVHLSDIEALHGLEGDFWVWCEVTREDHWPQIVGDEQRVGMGRVFSFDGRTAQAIQADLQMHALIIPDSQVEPTIQPYSTLVDFIEVPVGSSASKWFTLHSTGLEPLVIRDVSSSEDAFLVDWPGEVTLRTGEHITFNIVFAPQQERLYSGILRIETNAEQVPEVSLVGSGSLSVSEPSPSAPAHWRLQDPYPNPFNGVLTIRYHQPVADRVWVRIYTSKGQLIEAVNMGSKPAGVHQFQWNGGGLPSGVYLILIESSSGVRLAQKAVLLR